MRPPRLLCGLDANDTLQQGLHLTSMLPCVPEAMDVKSFLCHDMPKLGQMAHNYGFFMEVMVLWHVFKDEISIVDGCGVYEQARGCFHGYSRSLCKNKLGYGAPLTMGTETNIAMENHYSNR